MEKEIILPGFLKKLRIVNEEIIILESLRNISDSTDTKLKIYKEIQRKINELFI